MSAFLGLLWMGIGAASLWMAWLMSQRRLAYGSRWGILRPWARTSEVVWFEAHQAMATSVGLGGAVTILGGLVILVSGMGNIVGTVGFLVAVFASVVGQFVGLRQAKAAVDRLTNDPAPG